MPSKLESQAGLTGILGAGSGHPAALNLGDCFSYALAEVTGEPLLYVRDDFAHTDVSAAYPR